MVLRHSAHKGRCLGVLLLLVASCCIGASAIGVNYGTVGNNLPTPLQVVQLIQSTYISQVKIYSPDPTILSAFGNSGISLVVGTTNDEIAPLAASESFAQQWVTTNIASHYPSTDITCIVVGNEVLTTFPNSTNELVPAMQNLHTGLMNLGLDGKIKVSTPHSFGVLGISYPPSDGIFRTDLSGPVFSPMLDFLSQTGAPFMINAYPYFAYRDNPGVSIGYATFQPNADVVDSTTGLKYYNLFDAQVDATYAAMAKLGHQDISVTVSETGWPSGGDPGETGVGITNAQTYTLNLLQHINTNAGTPNRPGVPIDTFIFALFNENQKPGPGSERNFGLFQPDQSEVYNVGLVTKNTNGSSPPPPPMVSTSPPPPAAASPPPSSTPAPVSPPATSSPPPTSASPPHASPPPSSTPPSSSAPPSSTTSPPPTTAPPPPYPVPHVPPTGGSTPPPPVSTARPPPAASSPPSTSSPPPSTASPPPSTASPPPSTASPPPATKSPPVTPPPPPSFFTPPPGSNSSPPPHAETPPSSSSPPPTPTTASPAPASPPPTTASPPPASPPPTTPSPPPVSPPPTTASPPPVGSSPPPAPPAGGAPPGTPPAPPGTASGPDTWCVAKPGSPTSDLSKALNYACGEGGADCTRIQSGASCFLPNSLFAHASYAFSSYYAKNGRNYWNCFFGNSSLITITNPSYSGCFYP